MKRKYILIYLFILLSSCEKNQDENFTLLKYYGDSLEDIGYSISSVDGGYFIAGQLTDVSRSMGNLIDVTRSVKKMGIIRTGPDGNVIWQKYIGGRQEAVGLKALTLSDGSVICTGYVVDSVTRQRDILVVKVNAGGSGAIERLYNSTGDNITGDPKDGNQYGIDILQTGEGFLILASTDLESKTGTDSTGNAEGKKDILLLRINNDLDPVEQPNAYGFPGNDEGVAIKEDMNGGYIIAGTTDRSEPGQAGNNIFLWKFNSEVRSTQSKIIGGINNENAGDIEVLYDGYLLAGTIGNEGTTQQGYVWRFTENIFSPPVSAHPVSIDASSSSSFSLKAISRYKSNFIVMAGQTGTGSSSRMLIFVTDTDGNPVQGKQLVAGGTGIQVAYDVISDDDDNILVVGKNSYENNSMISLLKLRF